jgi:hypothetical protein
MSMIRPNSGLKLAAQCWCDPETEDIEMDPRLAEAVAKRIGGLLDGLEDAWGLIANAYGGDWDLAQNPAWKPAAERWRDEVWHPALTKTIVKGDEHVDSV